MNRNKQTCVKTSHAAWKFGKLSTLRDKAPTASGAGMDYSAKEYCRGFANWLGNCLTTCARVLLHPSGFAQGLLVKSLIK